METVFRVAFVYLFVWACFRMLGKRELTQMSPFELVTLLFIPQLFSRALTRQDYSMTNAIIGATTLFLLVFLTSAASYRYRRVARVVQAQPTVLVRHGQLVEAHLNRERISVHDIFCAMHQVGLERLDQLEWGILEGDGKIALVPSRDALGDSRADDRFVAASASSTLLGSRR
jgi:uncharacterized membrane protein YcaP (DUF421 family)